MNREKLESGQNYNLRDAIQEFGTQLIQGIHTGGIPTCNTSSMRDIPELYLPETVRDTTKKESLIQFITEMNIFITKSASNPDVYAGFQELGILLKDPSWTGMLPAMNGYNNTTKRALPSYLRLLSEYLIKGVFVGGAQDMLSTPQQKETFLKFIQFHEGCLKEYVRSNNQDGVFIYRGILPSVCMNYALVSLYREDFAMAFELIQRGFQAAIQTKSRVLAIKTIIIYLRLLRSLRDREIDQEKKNGYLNIEKTLYEHIGKSCSFLQPNEGEFDELGKLFESFKHGEEPDWYKSIRSQYFIAKFLALPTENGQLPLQTYNACRDADAEDKMLYVLGRICRIASGATNHIDDVMGLIEVNHEKDHFIILIPGIIALIEKYLADNSIDGQGRAYLDRAIVYISRFLRRKEKQREDFEGLSWFQQYFPLLKRYFYEVVKAENVSDWTDAVLLSQVEIIDRTLQNSFHERYKQYFPLYFQIPIGKDTRMFMYDVNGLKEIKGIPDNTEFYEVTIPGGSWQISGVGFHADMDFGDICKGIVPNLRQNLVKQSLSTLSAELIESLGAIGGSLSMYVQDIGEVQSNLVKVQGLIEGIFGNKEEQSMIIEKIAEAQRKLTEVLENIHTQNMHIPDTLEHLRKQLTELSGLAAFDLSLPEIGGCPNDKGE